MADETRTRAHDNMDLDALLWELDAIEDEYVDVGEGVGIEGGLDVEDESNRHFVCIETHTFLVSN